MFRVFVLSGGDVQCLAYFYMNKQYSNLCSWAFAALFWQKVCFMSFGYNAKICTVLDTTRCFSGSCRVNLYFLRSSAAILLEIIRLCMMLSCEGGQNNDLGLGSERRKFYSYLGIYLARK